ncbi:uncharacterized protein MONBRDRAFT_29181 [Monosiga brevicollis MX1]|uniref:AB hydrolase-1 domain-containing protein n=1 Tax=Monosiga brevicollis TaxID=81824 RepID=A9VAC5_MONBE|nr:uncharacterized protein MONBRDRAFT_29181 [Monosiga brevicollis MX1]EDQ85517.1 predicted protein [Monosiga brevicollis MX1]|eukprot:XP_001749708.1 hypothetical protein [Monosiga brevicollis MX1]
MASAAPKTHPLSAERPPLPFEVVERRFPTPGGHVGGWSHGPPSRDVVVAIHGWLEHADCWLPLLAHLPKDRQYVAIDLPGHGYSTHRGNGMGYAVSDYVRDIAMVMQQLRDQAAPETRFHLLGHSMGAMISFLYAGAFPEQITSLVLVDGVVPITADDAAAASRLASSIENWLVLHTKAAAQTPMSLEVAFQRLAKGNPDVESHALPYLFPRSVRQVKPGQFVFNRDLLVKQVTPYRFTPKQALSFARRIQCPTLAILANDGLRTAPPDETQRQLAALQEAMPTLRLAYVEGNHHVHMNDASTVAKDIADFWSLPASLPAQEARPIAAKL